jgi:putative flippase GtrA
VKRLSIEFTSYSSVAVLSAISDWIAFIILYNLTGAGALFSQGIARIVGAVFSFLINRSWSFHKQKGHGISSEAIRFLVLYCVSYSISLFTIYALLEMLDMPIYFAKISADLVCFVFNFIGMRLYVFSRSRGISSGADNLISMLRKSP